MMLGTVPRAVKLIAGADVLSRAGIRPRTRI